MKLLYQSFEIPNLLKNRDIPVGGAAVEWYTWIRAFRKLGHDFGLLTLKGISNELKANNDFDFVESYELNKGLPKLRLITYRIPSFFRAIRKYSPDFILQGCATENTGVLAIIAKILGKPFIHRIGSDMDVDGRIYKYYSFYTKSLHKIGLSFASHISCQNNYQYSMLKKKYPQKSISILHNPYFVKEFTSSVNHNKEYIAWIGNFRFEKNLPALSRIASSLPQYKFKIAGTKFHVTDEDTKVGLNKLKILKNVEFVGHLDNNNIPEFLSKAYCLLNTSRLEGFSNTFLESWAVGTPVISTKNVNPDNIISDFNVGIITNGYEDLPQVLDDLIEKKAYKKFEQRCKEYVSKNHNPIKLAEKFLQDMKDCIK